ncbi:hypothetical protein HMPREF1153_1016 [Selenomonas sp. CM52]|nr:hypothetical protein HMPREF1153_1016 [Selenomonas sp. CM52]
MRDCFNDEEKLLANFAVEYSHIREKYAIMIEKWFHGKRLPALSGAAGGLMGGVLIGKKVQDPHFR